MADSINITASPTSLTLSPGESAQATVTLRNTGQTVDQFTVSVEGLKPGWFSLPVSSVALFPNDQDTLQVVVNPPITDSRGGQFPFRIKVTSREDPLLSAVLDMSLRINALPEISLEISPQTAAGRKGHYHVLAANPGANEAVLDLKAKTDNPQLRLTPTLKNLKVLAGGRVETEVDASLGWFSLFWGKKETTFQVAATVPGVTEARSVSAVLIRIPWYRLLWQWLLQLRLPWLTKPPEITNFKATTDDNRQFRLSWSVKRASEVKLDEERIERQGEKAVRPSEARAFIISATNKYGSVTRKVAVQPITVPQVKTCERIKVSLSQTDVKANAGGAPVPVMVQVQNAGQIVDKFLVEVEGIDQSWYSRSASSLALMPQSSGQAQILLQPPKQKPVREGVYPFAVTVRSQASPDDATILLAQLVVLPLIEFKATVRPYRLNARRKGKFRVSLTNTGVSDVDLTLGASDLDEGLVFRFKDDTPAVPAWSTVEVPMTAKTKRGWLIGERKRYDIVVTARIGDKSQTANCELNHNPLASSWRPIFRIIRILIALAIIVVVVYFVLKWGGGWSTLVKSPQTWVDQFVATIEGWFSR
jgi:hypothetical protein